MNAGADAGADAGTSEEAGASEGAHKGTGTGTARTRAALVLSAALALVVAGCGGGAGGGTAESETGAGTTADGPAAAAGPTDAASASGAGGDDGGGSGGDEADVTALVAAKRALVADNLEPAALADIVVPSGAVPIGDGAWWRPTPAMTWNWQLFGPLVHHHEADIYVIDLFERIEDDAIERLHARGVTVLCYLSVGTYEFWRPDAHLFDPATLGKVHAGFVDERWVDPRLDATVRLMINRMDIARELGCDGVELDNMDAYLNDTGLSVTPEEQVRYARTLANAAHERNLAVALKNAVAILDRLEPWFDLAINEECFQYEECDLYAPMLDAGKLVLNAEFLLKWRDDEVERARLCVRAAALGLRTVVFPLLLDGSVRKSCD